VGTQKAFPRVKQWGQKDGLLFLSEGINQNVQVANFVVYDANSMCD
jgi:hypothetical protein